MSPYVRKKLVATAVALALTGLGGIALAAEAPGPSLHPRGADESSSSDSSSSSESDAPDAHDAGAPGEHPDNHGADVSAAAHSCPKEGHGDCVKAVARDNAGQGSDQSDDESDESAAPDTESPQTESPDDEAPETQSDDGAGHGKGHGHGG